MAQASDHAIQPSFSIGSQFISSQKLKVTVDKYPCGNLVITDVNHKILLKVKPYNSRLHIQRVLLDANDQPIAMLRKMNLTMHSRWNVYRGESNASSELMFTTKTKRMIQLKTNVSVTLANKMSNNDDCDLRIKGNWSKGNCAIYMGDSSTVIAEMHKPQALKYAKDKFTVTIEANMDYACVVALVAIVDAIEHPDENQGSAEAVGGVADVVTAVLSATSN